MLVRHANKMGVKPNTNSTGATFTDKEIEILMEFYTIEGDDVYKRLPNRKKVNVIAKMNQLGIRKLSINKWEEWEKDIIKEFYPKMGLKMTHMLPNRSRGSINTMAGRLGLKVNNKVS